ncbi:AMP-binding protein [Streptomyces sp. NPDC050392]|uniref:AMP-binding protein n=1 Tax=Streptomyces sp. NPDC050392 TaxID=3155782 RepID=UPI00343795C5
MALFTPLPAPDLPRDFGTAPQAARSAPARDAHLTDLPGYIDLPWDRPWTTASGRDRDVVRVPVDAAVPARAAHGDDPRAAWLSVLALFVRRFSGQPRFPVVVTAADGRISCAAVTMPVGGSFREAATEAARRLRTADSAAPATPAWLSGRLRAGAAADGARPFSVALVLEPMAGEGATAGADADLTLRIRADGGVRLDYATALVDRSTAERFADHLAAIAEAAGSRPDHAVEDSDLLPERERMQLLARLTQPAPDPAGPVSVSARVAAVAARTPQAPALSQNGRVLTYRRLNEAVDRLAHRLARQGVGPGVRAAVFLERSPAYVVAELAVLRTGGVCVCLDPADSDAWIHTMLAEAGPAAVVTHGGLALRLPRAVRDRPRLIVTAEADDTAAEPGPAFPEPPADAATPSHFSYTSGSTGFPRGVETRHGAIAHLMDWAPKAFALTPDSTVSWASSPGFAISRIEWMPALAAGARLEIADRRATTGPERLHDWLSDRNVSHALLTTSTAERLWSLERSAPAGLRLLLSVGEPLRQPPPPGLPYQVALSYGSTEAAVVTCSHDARRGPSAEPAGPFAVGRPIDGVQVLLLDEADRPVPPGVVGRVHVSGPGAEGVARRAGGVLPVLEGLTATAPMLPTGDLARALPDGSLEVLGRQEDHAWVGGRSVHTKAVERALCGLAGVRDAAVLARESGGRTVLAAYVVPAGNRPFSPHRLLAELVAVLPTPARPQIWVPLDVLPRLAGGKLDRQKLAALGPALRTPPAPAAEEPAPQTPRVSSWFPAPDWG